MKGATSCLTNYRKKYRNFESTVYIKWYHLFVNLSLSIHYICMIYVNLWLLLFINCFQIDKCIFNDCTDCFPSPGLRELLKTYTTTTDIDLSCTPRVQVGRETAPYWNSISVKHPVISLTLRCLLGIRSPHVLIYKCCF